MAARTHTILVAGLGALLGVVGGLVADAVFPEGSDTPTTSQPGPSQRPSYASDDLGVGAPHEDLDCVNEYLLVVGRGDSRFELAGPIADNPDAKYLETAESCRAFFYPVTGPDPKYLAYLGPFAFADEACTKRMSEEYDTSYVTRLADTTSDPIRCACVLPAASAATLAVGEDNNRQWTLAAEELLDRIGLRPTDDEVDRTYTKATAVQVRALERQTRRVQTGIMDEGNWKVLRKQACGEFKS